MKKWHSRYKTAFAMTAVFTLMTTGLCAAETAAKTPETTPQTSSASKSNLKIGVANFRKCVEESKKGKQETAALESMQAQMESSLQDLQKQLSEVSAKLNDPDYLDGVTQEAENELKHKYRNLGQEYQMMQQQFVQALQQANMRVIQSLAELVAATAKEVAQSKQLDLVINEEAAFYYNPSLDVSEEIVSRLNKRHEEETKALLEQQKNAANNKTPAAPATPVKK